jgi:FkbM family methyltransferase
MLLNAIKGFLNKKQKNDAYKRRYKSTGLTWLRIKYLKHANHHEIKYHNLLGKQVAYKNGGELMHGLVEIFADEIYKISLPGNATIIDCGANIGLSVLYLKQNHPDAKVIAFEPDAINFELLQKNVKTFGLTNVELRREAVWNKNEVLHFNNAGSQASRISDQNNDSVEVEAIRLRDIIDKKIDFLKIDIEGAEYDVLVDIADKLHLVESLFVEYHGKFHQNKELIELLSIINSNGFIFYIQEAAKVYDAPFSIIQRHPDYDLQLNIFCMRNVVQK